MQDFTLKVNCSHTKLEDIHRITPSPKNNNRHSIEQITRLAKIIDFQGMRSPIVVSKLSGFVVKGHCRLEALKLLGAKQVPIDYQDYENEAQEYADMTADNAVASWAEFDWHLFNTELEENDFDIDMDFFGIEKIPNFDALDPEDLSDKNKEIDTENFGNDLEHQCPKCGFEFSK